METTVTPTLRYFKGTLSDENTADRLIVSNINTHWFGFLFTPEIDICFTFEGNTLDELLQEYQAEAGNPDYKLVEVDEPDETFDFRKPQFNRTHRNWNMQSWDVEYFQRVLRDNLKVFDDDRLHLDVFHRKSEHMTKITDFYFMQAIIKQARLPYATQKYDSRRFANLSAMYVNIDPTADVGSEGVYKEIWIVYKESPNIVLRIR